MRFPARVPSQIVIAAAAILAACSGGSKDSSTPTTPVTPTPAITISASASTLDLTQGATASFTVTVSRSGGFAGDVAVTVEGLPANVTASALTVTAANTSGTVTLTANTTATVAASSLTVRGSGTGVTSVTAAIALNVRAAAATGAVSVSFNPSSLTIIQGATVNVTATITRTGGFAGPVTLAVTGAPTGLTVVITPTASANQTATVTSSSANLAFTAGTVTAGVYTIGISASGTGVTTNSVNFSTTVNPPVAGTGNATFSFCQASGIPVGVWQQDGATAAWTKVNAGANNTFPVNITQSKGGVAYEYSPVANSYQLQVIYGTQAELQQQGTAICANQGQTSKSVSGTVTGLTALDLGFVGLGSATASPNVAAGGSYTLNNVPNGSLDLIASRTALTVNGSSFTSALTGIVIRRNQNFPAGTVITPIDLSATSTEAFAPVSKNLTILNLNGDQALTSLGFFTGNGSFASLFTDLNASTAATRPFPTLPANKMQAGDFHYLTVQAASSFSGQLSILRSRSQFFSAGGDKTFSLAPNPNAVTVSNLNFAAPVRLRAQTVSVAEYDKFFFVTFSQAGAAPRFVQVSYTTAYLTTAASVQNVGSNTTASLNGGVTLNLDVPDLGPTYAASWGLQPLALTNVQAGFSGWNSSGGGASPTISESTTYNFALRFLTYTP